MTEDAQLILEAVLEIVRLRVPDLKEIRLEQEFVLDLGLGSLDLAELSATIETKLKLSVFDDVAINGFLTVGELVEFCEQARRASRS